MIVQSINFWFHTQNFCRKQDTKINFRFRTTRRKINDIFFAFKRFGLSIVPGMKSWGVAGLGTMNQIPN